MNFSSVSPAIFWSINETSLLTQGLAAAEQGEGFQGNQLGWSCLKRANLSSSSGSIDIVRASVASADRHLRTELGHHFSFTSTEPGLLLSLSNFLMSPRNSKSRSLNKTLSRISPDPTIRRRYCATPRRALLISLSIFSSASCTRSP